MDLALLMTVIGVLVALTNIFVQVLKQLIGEYLPTSLVAFVVAIVLTLLAFFAWASYTQTAIEWYYIPDTRRRDRGSACGVCSHVRIR